MRRLAILFVLSYGVSGGVAQAATYHVAKTGNNGNSCTQAQTTSTPKQTINAGIACLSTGDTLLVRGGSYDEGISNVPSGTSWNNKVRIASYPGEAVWLKPRSIGKTINGNVVFLDGDFHYVEFDGINIDATVISGGDGGAVTTSTNNGFDPHHIRFQNAEIIAGAFGGNAAVNFGAHTLIGATGGNEAINLKIHGGGRAGLCGWPCASYGIYIKGPNNLVDNCDIFDTSSAGIQIYNGPDADSPDNNIIRNTRIHDITRYGNASQVWGIIVDGHNNQIYNNVVYGINIGTNSYDGNAAILVGDNFNGNKIWNNTIYNFKNTGIYIGSGSTNDVRNNIVYQATGVDFINRGSGTVQSNNLFGVNPLFEDAGAGRFALTADSPARNAGATITQVTSDIVGATRPNEGAYDIGAYELTSSLPMAAAPIGLRIID